MNPDERWPALVPGLEGIAEEPRYEAKNYLHDALEAVHVDEPLAGFFGYIVRGADHYVINTATADRPDTQAATARHEIAHHFFPNFHMSGPSYESAILLGTSTHMSEQPRGNATFQMRDLDIARAYNPAHHRYL